MELYSKLIIDKYPIVLIDRSIPGLELPLVSANNKDAFYKITTHLLDLGHKKIIFAGTDIYGISSEYERYKGFCEAHIDYGIPLLDKHVYSKNMFVNKKIDIIVFLSGRWIFSPRRIRKNQPSCLTNIIADVNFYKIYYCDSLLSREVEGPAR